MIVVFLTRTCLIYGTVNCVVLTLYKTTHIHPTVKSTHCQIHTMAPKHPPTHTHTHPHTPTHTHTVAVESRPTDSRPSHAPFGKVCTLSQGEPRLEEK